MQIIRYLNGRKLHGAMPAMILDQEGIGTILQNAYDRKQMPLPEINHSAILLMEERGLGKDI